MIVFLCHAFADKAIWGIEKAGEKTADDAADRPCKSAFFKYTTDQDAAGERQNDAAGFASCDFFMEKYCRQKQYKNRTHGKKNCRKCQRTAGNRNIKKNAECRHSDHAARNKKPEILKGYMDQRAVVDEHTDACNESCEKHTAADDREIINSGIFQSSDKNSCSAPADAGEKGKNPSIFFCF